MPILVDTLSFRARSDSLEKIKQILGISETIYTWEKGSSFNGYPNAIYFGGIKIGYDGLRGFNCYVHMSGKGCRTWEDFTKLEGGFMQLFEYLIQFPEEYHFARVDLACDDYTDTLNIERIEKYRRNKRYSTKTTYFTTVMGSEEIAYIGSPKSHTRLRIYNKKLERGYRPEDEFEHEYWYRAEFQFRDKCATACVDAFVTYDNVSVVFFGKLLDFIRFTTKPNKTAHAERLNTSSWWLEFCQNSPRLKFFYEPGSEYNLSRLEKFCKVGAGSSINTLIRAKNLSPYQLYDYFVKDDNIHLRQDQIELIRRQEFERGVGLLDSSLYKGNRK